MDLTDRQLGSSRDLRTAVMHVPPNANWAEYQAACDALDALGADPLPDWLRARVALVASFTIEPFVPFLRVEGARAGVWIEPYVVPYGQYMQELLAGGSGLYAFQPRVSFLMIEGEVLWEMWWARARLGSNGRPDDFLDNLRVALDAFQAHGSGLLVVNDFAAPRSLTEGPNAFRSEQSFGRALSSANVRLREDLTNRTGAFVFPLAEVVAEIGRAHAFNRRTHYRGHLSWSDALMREVAQRYSGLVAASLGKASKCIVLDLDNTLWGGVLGEDGMRGLAIGPQWPGREFLDFQRQILELHKQGMLLAVCSKNNEGETLACLRDLPEQLIRVEHLAAYRINWEDKATNVRELARELNISLEHMVLIDDSPHEREWIRRALPDVLVPELPDDPAEFADWIARLPSLRVLQQTAEDAQRTLHHHQERMRARLQEGSGGHEAFLRSLDLRVRIAPVTDATIGRVAQLLAKTNQFNLTTRRHDESMLQRQTASGRWRVYTIRVSDRFGDAGLTGVAIVAPQERRWHLDSFLLSCRVIGKSVETSLLAAITEDAARAGVEVLTAEFIDSGRNAAAGSFLPSHGFAPTPEGHFQLSLQNQTVPAPEWITIERPAAESEMV